MENFAAQVDRLVVIEELDPFIEDAVRAMGIEAEGKAIIPRLGELDSAIIAEAFEKADSKSPPPEDVTGRPRCSAPVVRIAASSTSLESSSDDNR